MAKNRMPLPPADYRRIYEVIYSVSKSAGGRPHRSCIFFAVAGAALLREYYDLPAKFHAGSAAILVGPNSGLVFAEQRGERLAASPEVFHAWVEADGYAVDFMAPLFADVALEGGLPPTPRRMFQKPVAATKAFAQFTDAGDFLLQSDATVTSLLLARFRAKPRNLDLVRICRTCFAKPPALMREFVLADSRGLEISLSLDAPAIDGAW